MSSPFSFGSSTLSHPETKLDKAKKVVDGLLAAKDRNSHVEKYPTLKSKCDRGKQISFSYHIVLHFLSDELCLY